MPDPGVQDGRNGFGLYIHWPFCLAKCPYCDFNSHVTQSVDQRRWLAALQTELTTLAPRVRATRLDSIFLGGGTPSLMSPDTVAGLIETARRLWPVAPDCEITLEANPTSVEAAKLRAFREGGANRISLGVQALDNDALRFLGRGHDSAEAIAAVETAHALFDQLSFDLIYARPGQDLDDWKNELDRALSIAGSHMSLYQLVIEPGTVFHARFNHGELVLPEDETAGMLYEITQERMAAAGMPAYEISNHARANAECRHNLIYWRSGNYLGIGPGAHGRLTDQDGQRHRLRLHRAPAIWLERVERDGHAVTETAILDPDEQFIELVMMGLRLTEGLPVTRLQVETGRDLEALFDPALIRDLRDAGYLSTDHTRLQATAAGRQRLDSVIRVLITSRLSGGH